ncbi:MAG: PCRF domain-containing protein, partial [Gammaproteobacteria bacterium]
MKASIRDKLEQLVSRHEEVGALLSDAETMADASRFRDLGKEYAELDPVVLCYRQWQQAQTDGEEAAALLKDPDPDMRAMAEESQRESAQRVETLEAELQTLLLPKDPDDSHNVFLEIRA